MLRLDGVSYRYPGASRDALTDVSLSIGLGEFHAVLGPNGSGKTTLVRIALGAITPLVGRDRKSTRLNSSHDQISYAVFCLKKKTAAASTARPRPAPG